MVVGYKDFIKILAFVKKLSTTTIKRNIAAIGVRSFFIV